MACAHQLRLSQYLTSEACYGHLTSTVHQISLIILAKHGKTRGKLFDTSRATYAATDHRLAADDPVIFVGLDPARADGRFPERTAFSCCFLGDMRGILVADHRRQRDHQHQRVTDV